MTNEQRKYLGLDFIENHWERVVLKGNTYRPDSILYFEGNTIKRQIISTDDSYKEYQYNDLTKDRKILLPKTNKGKESKLTASTLEKRCPYGIYFNIENYNDLIIGNFNTQTTFYSTCWERYSQTNKTNRIPDLIMEFISKSPEDHLVQIESFKNAKRKHVNFKAGDYFSFKINRTEFGFGRLLFDIQKIRKKGLLPDGHGLNLFLGTPLLVKLFAYKSAIKNVDISILDSQPKLPSDVMMDNLLLYGEYEIIGHKELCEEDFDFPISYAQNIDGRKITFLQWGLMHKELPLRKFNKYIVGKDEFDRNPFGYHSIGFRPSYGTIDIVNTISNNGVFDFDACGHYKAKQDLRNPKNNRAKSEIFKAFKLDPDKNYIENCKLSNTISITEFLKLPD